MKTRQMKSSRCLHPVCSGGSWEKITTLRVAFCVKLLLEKDRKKAFRFIEAIALGKFAVTKNRGMSMIARKEFDTWRDGNEEGSDTR